MLFREFNLTDGEVLNIINTYEWLINRASTVNGKIILELKEEIIVTIYLKLTKNRRK